MPATRYDVVGIGNAIVDVLAHTTDAFLASENLPKGAMNLVDAERSADIYSKIGPAVECSGGSAANTIAALASLGGKSAYIGKIRDDQLGAFFGHDIRALGIDFPTAPATDGPATATSLVLVTDDAERTMQTYLGACVGLTPDDIDEDTIAAAKVTYMEGYLYDPPAAKEAFRKAARLAHRNGRQVSLSLSDPFCVDRHRDAFLDLVRNHVDILFANEEEIISLYRVGDFDAALREVHKDCDIAALTRSEKGSVIVAGDEVHVVDAEPVGKVVDTTGAGDAYAAGFLYGITHARDLATSARIGGIAAAEVISHMGARPDADLADMIRTRLG